VPIDAVAYHRFNQGRRDASVAEYVGALRAHRLSLARRESMLRDVGLRPTRQRIGVGWILFGQRRPHITAEMLYEEATKPRCRYRLPPSYNTLPPVHRLSAVAPGRGLRLEDLFRHNVSQHHHFFVEGNDLLDIPDQGRGRGRTPIPAGRLRGRGIDVVCGCAARRADAFLSIIPLATAGVPAVDGFEYSTFCVG